MLFLFRHITSRSAMYFALTTTAFDAIGMAASFISGKTAADLHALLTAVGFGS